MKKILLTVLLLLSISAFSQENEHDEHDDNQEDCPNLPLNGFTSVLLVAGCLYAFKKVYKTKSI